MPVTIAALYQKSGKSLCTLYPQQGYFFALVPGKTFEVRNEDTLVDLKMAVEVRVSEIATKKRGNENERASSYIKAN